MSAEKHAPEHETTAAGTTTRVSNVKWPTLDHLAIGVRRWEDSYERFAGELGGQWAYGGPAGDYAPYQLVFGEGMRLEFISPHAPDGFMQRFMKRHGPAPHHVTFKVPSLEETEVDLARLGFETFGEKPGLPVWRESFVHPKHTSIGTLVQIVQADEEFIARRAPQITPPDGFPAQSARTREVAMVGITSPDLKRAHDLLGRALLGDVVEEGDGWFFATWGRGRSLLVRHPSVAPCAVPLWAGAPEEGVSFVLFGPRELAPSSLRILAGGLVKLPHQESTGIPVWLL